MKKQGLIVTFATVILLSGGVNDLVAQDPSELPKPVSSDNFTALKTQSPFLRELDLSETYSIRALATIGETPVATLYNKRTKETHMVFSEAENERGMKLVEIVESTPDNPLSAGAKVAFAGEIFEVKYDPSQTMVAPRSTAKSGGGDKKDGEQRRGPSKEDMERYKSLNDEQRKKFRDYIGYTMKKYPNLSREERGNMIRGAMTKILDGRELNMEPIPDKK